MTTGEIHRQKICLTARQYVGVPFRHQGRSPLYGFDCVGLLLYVAEQQGGKVFDRLDYKKIPRPQAISRQAEAAGFNPLPLSHRQPGDAVIIRIGRHLEHAAILTDRGIIHACETYGRVVEHGLDKGWSSRIVAAYAFPGLSGGNPVGKEIIQKG